MCYSLWYNAPLLYNTPTFPNLIHSSHNRLPVKMGQTECSETSAHKIQTLGNNPEESIQYLEHGKILKSRIFFYLSLKVPLLGTLEGDKKRYIK